MYKRFPDTIATLPFIPAGLCIGHKFFLPWIHESLYDEFHVWPFFTFLFAIVTTASIISIIKLSNGKYIFEHFVYLFTASVLFVISGILFVIFTVEYTAIPLFINAIASGMVIIAGLSYVNIRAIKTERPFKLSICHVLRLLGFAGTFTIYVFVFTEPKADEDGGVGMTNPNDKLREFYQILGYSLIASSALFLFVQIINELLQRQGLTYNYRDCLDHDNSIANNYCKLFSKNEVIIERNTAVSTVGLWKSSENLLPQSKRNDVFTTLWTIYMMIPKLHGALLLHYFLLPMSMNAAYLSFANINYTHGITIWIVLIQSVIGCIMLRFVHSKKVYVSTSIIAVIAIGFSLIFYGQWPPTGVAICLWIYFAAVAISIAIPDIALLEMSKIRFNEGVLAAGYFVEIIPIAVLQLAHREAHTLTKLLWYTNKFFEAYVVASIVILIVASTIYMLHLPNTFAMSLLQIQNELLKHHSYFTFIANDEEEDEGNRRSDFSIKRGKSDMYGESAADSGDQLPPVNNAKQRNDLYAEFSKPPTIIPRANLVRTPTNDGLKNY